MILAARARPWRGNGCALRSASITRSCRCHTSMTASDGVGVGRGRASISRSRSGRERVESGPASGLRAQAATGRMSTARRPRLHHRSSSGPAEFGSNRTRSTCGASGDGSAPRGAKWVRSVDVVEDCGIRWRAVVERGADSRRETPTLGQGEGSDSRWRSMFLGEYQHSLDAKGRVILPARFRDQLEGGAVMARALDGCLAVYPLDEFDRRRRRTCEERASAARERAPGRPHVLRRRGRDHARQAGPGRRSRQHLREYAGLDREVIVAGSFDHIEIWDAQRFRERDADGMRPRSWRRRASTTSCDPQPACSIGRAKHFVRCEAR